MDSWFADEIFGLSWCEHQHHGDYPPHRRAHEFWCSVRSTIGRSLARLFLHSGTLLMSTHGRKYTTPAWSLSDLEPLLKGRDKKGADVRLDSVRRGKAGRLGLIHLRSPTDEA